MIANKFVAWFERYLFRPKPYEYLLALLFLPLSLVLTAILYLRYLLSNAEDFGIPIISVGNLVLGGSGKTPVTIALASAYQKSVVILRGYNRESKGLHIVSEWGRVLVDVKISGDEAMLLAEKLPQSTVIVCESRVEAIEKAKSMGAKVIFLDDAYSKHQIKKLDLVLRADEKRYLPLIFPSGPFRDALWPGKKAVIIEEQRDFRRVVKVENATQKMLLVTAISKPWRLDPYLPEVIEKVYFPDHYGYEKAELVALMEQYQAESILTTEKDAVKMETFDLPLSILSLTLELDAMISQQVQNYIESYHATEN